MTDTANARELIADVLNGEALQWFSGRDELLPVADAILSALPEIVRFMVKPLAWGEWSKGYSVQTWNHLGVLSQAESSIGTYRVGRLHKYVKSTDKKNRPFDSEYSSSWYVDAPLSSGLLGPFNGDVEAKAAANAHHRAQVMEGLGL